MKTRLTARTQLLLILALACAGCDDTQTPDATPLPETVDRASTWQPWAWRGWQKFPSLYFAAEPDGYMSAEQMEKISRFELAILEFRSGQFVAEESTGQWANGDLAGLMAEQVARIKAAHPDGPAILTYRSAMWAGSMYAKQWDALQTQTLFLGDTRHCEGFINYPMDVDESGFDTELTRCRWDWRAPGVGEVYQDIVAAAAAEGSDGVFFDNAQSVACDESQHLSLMSPTERGAFMRASHEVLAQAFETLADNGKYAILSTTNGLADHGAQVPWENDCPLTEEATLDALDGIPFARNNEFWMWNLGDLAARQIRNTLAESARGIPVIVHMPYFPQDGGCLEGCRLADGTVKRFTEDEFLEFGMAAFLVSMGRGSYFGFSDMQSDPEGGGWFDQSWRYHAQFDRIVTGAPLGVAQVSADGMTFTRQFENGEVWVNAADGTYAFNLETP